MANSPDLKTEFINAVIGAMDAHNLMSTQVLNSKTIQNGLIDILLNHTDLYDSLRARASS